jgi:hypothetical protein
MGNTEAQRAQRRGEGRRGREEKRGEEREEKRSAPNALSLPVALGLGELCAFAVSLEPTGRLEPFRLHFLNGLVGDCLQEAIERGS